MSPGIVCAVCGFDVGPDSDHTRVERERVRTDDRNSVDDYYLHDSCAVSIFEGWSEP